MTRARGDSRRRARAARVVVVCAACLGASSGAGCKREGAATNTNANANGSSASDARASTSSAPTGGARDGASTASTDAASGASTGSAPTGSTSTARATYQGRATGRGVDPPVHEFRPRITAESWSGNGAVALEVPADGDGPVSGTVALGALSFRVRGFRTGAHVRALLDEARDGGAAAASDDGGAPEDVFRGTLDAEITGNAMRGTWEASAEAGARRRSGTLEAQRP